MSGEIKLKSEKNKQKKKIIKISKFILLIILLLLLVSYCYVSIIYNGGTFTIRLDKNLYLKNGIIIYDDPEYKVFRTDLYADPIDFLDNISYKWLPDDIGLKDGSNNGENYIEYTFYIENMGETLTHYYSEIVIDNVIKDVDEAIRIRVYKNGKHITYAKKAKFKELEKNTVEFKEDNLVFLSKEEKFSPGDINKYTIVIWLEGSDPECTNNILGGEIKLHMAFNSEIVKEK